MQDLMRWSLTLSNGCHTRRDPTPRLWMPGARPVQGSRSGKRRSTAASSYRKPPRERACLCGRPRPVAGSWRAGGRGSVFSLRPPYRLGLGHWFGTVVFLRGLNAPLPEDNSLRPMTRRALFNLPSPWPLQPGKVMQWRLSRKTALNRIGARAAGHGTLGFCGEAVARPGLEVLDIVWRQGPVYGANG